MRILTFVMLIVCSSFSQASTIKLNYSVFFGYMKTMYKLDYEFVTTAFYLIDRKDKTLCKIQNAQMRVENVYDPILFESKGRLLPFYSDKHRKDGGVLLVDIDDNKTISSCDLQIRVMVKERELSTLNEKKLIIMSEQLQGVLKKNAGMIGQYFLPSFEGIRLQFSPALTTTQLANLGLIAKVADNNDVLISQGSFSIIDKINELDLTIVRITPWMESN